MTIGNTDQGGSATPDLKAFVAGLSTFEDTSKVQSRDLVGELTRANGHVPILPPRRVVAAVAASETSWEDSPTLLLNFIQAVQQIDTQ